MGGFTVISNVEHFLAVSQSHTEPYTTEVNGIRFVVHPQVMSPKYSYAPQFFSNHWDITRGMTVLDVGTGSGILAVFAGLAGANVTAVDINPHAVACAKENARNNGLHALEVCKSDIYAAVKGRRFDRILFNAPYWNRAPDPNVPLTYGVFDEGYQSVAAFLKQAKHYLVPNGKVLLGFALQDDVQLMEKHIAESGLQIERCIDETRGHTRRLYYLTAKDTKSLHEQVHAMPRIGVFGSDGDHCSEQAKKLAYDVGKLLSHAGALVCTGGGGGVMEAASKGVSEHGGISIGILSGSKATDGNGHNTLSIPTGFGYARSQILELMVDAAIVIEGGFGTLSEAGGASWYGKPVVAIQTSGGTAEAIAGKKIDRRNLPIVISADSARDAVEKVLEAYAKINV